jgi:hypothetical protein
MSNSLDISIHGPQRVAIVEQLVHICRYSPGLVLLEGDEGKSPVNFLRHMADLLRDELDFALLDIDHCDVLSIAAELVSQWYIYQAEEHMQTDVQSVHHYLDLGLQSGRLALIVIERASLLSDEAINFLIGMMARHSRLSILFAGVVDPRPLLRRAHQAEVPVQRIDIPDPVNVSDVKAVEENKSKISSNLSASNFDHTFSDETYELPDDGYEDDLFDLPPHLSEQRGRREPLIREKYSAGQRSTLDASDSILGVSTRLSAAQVWGAATMAKIRKKKPGGLLLILSCLTLLVLLLLVAANLQEFRSADIVEDDRSRVSAVVTAPLSPQAPLPQPSVATSTVVDTNTPIPATPPIAPAAVQPIAGTAEPQPVVVPENNEVANTVQPIPDQTVLQPKPDKIKVDPTINAPQLTEKQWRAKPNNYTIQIAAAHSEPNITKLAKKLSSSHPYYVYRTKRDGKPWFILIYGSFAGKQAASLVRDSLAPDIRKDSTPWVRKQGEVFAQ